MELVSRFRKHGNLTHAFANKNAKPSEVGTVVTERVLREVRDAVLEAVAPGAPTRSDRVDVRSGTALWGVPFTVRCRSSPQTPVTQALGHS